MATWKRVGQRVRVLRSSLGMVGREGTIVRIPAEAPERDCGVVVDGVDSGWHDKSFAANFGALTPILDDSQWADEQIAKLKRDVMKPIEIDDKQMEEVRG